MYIISDEWVAIIVLVIVMGTLIFWWIIHHFDTYTQEDYGDIKSEKKVKINE